MILGDASVPHLVEAEHPLQDAEGMLDLGPYTRLTAVFLFLQLVHIVLELRALTGHVLGLRRDLFDRLCPPMIATVAPHLALLPMEQLGQHMAVGHAGRAGCHRVDVALFRIHADVRLQPKEPLVFLPGLVHLCQR